MYFIGDISKAWAYCTSADKDNQLRRGRGKRSTASGLRVHEREHEHIHDQVQTELLRAHGCSTLKQTITDLLLACCRQRNAATLIISAFPAFVPPPHKAMFTECQSVRLLQRSLACCLKYASCNFPQVKAPTLRKSTHLLGCGLRIVWGHADFGVAPVRNVGGAKHGRDIGHGIAHGSRFELVGILRHAPRVLS